MVQVFYAFRGGLIYFFVGMMTVYLAGQSMTPSLEQDLVVLLGLLLTIVGFFIAMMAYMRLIIGRFVQFFSKK
ncbi:MAG: hypothetical protein COA42_06650 [Alteromonadaceae bacterium]|nr:MAG: hypothetical protein COA42_06650 [Alteromonadaceae bacterium]